MSAGKPVLFASVVTAIEEQQIRVWRLYSLLDVLRESLGDDGKGNLEDVGGALDGLIEYAHQIHLALDTGAIAARAAELEDEKRQEAECEARRKKVLGLDGGEESSDDGPTRRVQ